MTEREALFKSCIPLAQKMSRKYSPLGVPLGLDLEDLQQEAFTGLLIAADRFDSKRGCKFVTVAWHWIRCKINGALRRARQEREKLRLEADFPPASGDHLPGIVERLTGRETDLSNADCLKDRLPAGLRRLSPRLRKVLVYRFGLAGQPPKTLKEVASVMDVSKERVRQLEKQALDNLIVAMSREKWGKRYAKG